MSRRATTLAVAAFIVVALAVLGGLLPVPFVVLRPGPTADTLGTLKGSPLITVSGHQTYATSGNLRLVTVAYQGGPGGRVDLFTAVRGWLDPRIAVVPEETIFPRTQTVKQVEEQNTQEMTDSQETATAAALTELKIPLRTAIKIVKADKGSPADGIIKPGDQVLVVDGTKVTKPDEMAAAVQKHKPGERVQITVKRAGGEERLLVTPKPGPDGKPRLGVTLQSAYNFPFDVKISVGEVGGPSAGLMFSLGLVDKLTPGEMTGGRNIAGTGTITADGRVGPIGGIQQKMAGARKAGATIFLTPAANCADAVRARPDGLRLVRADDLHGAVQAIEALRTGSDNVPACPAQ